MPKLLIIDSNALVHRAFHAYPDTLVNADGLYTNAIFGFTQLFLTAFEKVKPDYVICAFDTPKPTFRHLEFVDYKAHRKPLDEKLIQQFPEVKKIVEAFNIPIFAIEGFEADDVIGTIVDKLSKSNPEIHKVILTGDSDEYQLVDDKTDIYMAGRFFRDSKIFTDKEVDSKLGYDNKYVPDYKSLRGDTSDNIPGVRGIGEVTAKSLITSFGSLENIYSNLEKIDKKVAEKLINSQEIAYQSKRLATISRDVPISLDLEQSKFDGFDLKDVIELFKKYEFRTLIGKVLKMFPDKASNETKAENKEVVNVNSQKKETVKNKNHAEAQSSLFDPSINLTKDIKNFEKITLNGTDLSKTSEIEEISDSDSLIRILKGVTEIYFLLLGVNLYILSDKIVFVDLSKMVKDKNTEVIHAMRDVLENKEIRKISIHIKKQLHEFSKIFRTSDIAIENYFDITTAAFLLSGGVPLNSTKNILLELSSDMNFSDISVLNDDTLKASADNAFIELSYIKSVYMEELKLLEKSENAKVKLLLKDVEHPLIKVLFAMEELGIKLDKNKLADVGKEIDESIKNIEKDIYKVTGHEFNIASPKQVGETLAEEFKIPLPKKKKTGSYSTDEGTLLKFAGSFEICNLILRFRELAKLRSTYVNSLIDISVDDEQGNSIIHTTYNQSNAATGRLSSINPNLQNIPSGSKESDLIKSSFVAREGKTFVSFDYSQQELRILAHISGEEKLIEAFIKGQDIHKTSASVIFNVDYDKVTPEQRATAKTVNFGVVYGISGYGLGEQLKIPAGEAQKFINEFFERFPKILIYFKKLEADARSQGFAETILGRRREFKELNSKNFQIRNRAYRELINFPIQGSAADMTKLAMIKLFDGPLKNTNDWKMLLQIHDELLFEVNDISTKDEVIINEIKKIMSSCLKLSVPAAVDMKIGKSWGAMTKVK
ncbi:MAG: DNA polymerase I [bacterium]